MAAPWHPEILNGLTWRSKNPWVLTPAAGLLLTLLAITFEKSTGQTGDVVLFSGQDAFLVIVLKGGPGRFRLAASAVVRPSPPCSSAQPAD